MSVLEEIYVALFVFSHHTLASQSTHTHYHTQGQGHMATQLTGLTVIHTRARVTTLQDHKIAPHMRLDDVIAAEH